MNADGAQVLLSVEADAYVQSLTSFEVNEIGSKRWYQQHEHLEKLNMQAALNASQQEDEFVKEFLITYEKIPVLMHELIATEVWKQNVWPQLVDMEFEPKTTFPIYMVLYHEATVANLLETVLYYRESCEAAEESVLDMVDYCYRKLTQLVARQQNQEEDEEEEEECQINGTEKTNLEELEKQEKILDLDISIKAVSILRYLTDAIHELPLSALTRLLNTHNIPILLVELVENPPWTSRKHGKTMKYIDNKWQEISQGDVFKITKIEGQVWLALYHLLMDEECVRKYELDSYRKNTILKLRSYMTEILLDQIPVLGNMQRYLENLSIMDPPPVKQDLILEQVPEIRDSILKKYAGKWRSIAKTQSKKYFTLSDADMTEQAKKWASTYNFDVLETLMDPPKCAVCGAEACKRCSRCQNEWYCRRECQVSHWKKHKQACDLLYDSLEQLKNKEEELIGS